MLQKTFYKTLKEVNIFPEKIKKCLDDKRLTNIEKKIIESYLLIRNNRNAEAAALMQALPISEFPFVEAQKNLIFGIALNNQSEFKAAASSIKKAVPVLKSLDSHYFLFIAYFNLCMIHRTFRQLPEMLELIQAMEAIPVETEIQPLRLLRSKFMYYAEINDFKTASAILSQIDSIKSSMPESDIISHYVYEFMFYVKQDNFEKCEDALGEMKKFRKFHLTENYNFMKLMLNHLTKNTPIYLTGDEFSSTPLLNYQLRLIHALEEQNNADAEKYWSLLVTSFPESYKENFCYTGEKCLFSLCLDKHFVAKTIVLPKRKEEKQNLLDALLNLLQSTPTPVSKFYLYEFLWGEPAVEKDDLLKVSRLVARIRAEKMIDVQFKKGTYFIEKGPKKKFG